MGNHTLNFMYRQTCNISRTLLGNTIVDHSDVESVKTTSMKDISTGVLYKNEENYLRCKDKAKKTPI